MFNKLFEKLVNRNVLYYPGCLTKVALPQIEENYKKILNNLGINFIMIKDEELCCGSPVHKAGYNEEFYDLIEKNKAIFKKYGIGKVITNCPGCYNTFRDIYGLETEHMSQVIWKNIDKLKLKSFKNERIYYHDPCHLGRYSNVYDEPRLILKKLDFDLKEFPKNRENALCCGAGGGLKTNAPKIANKIAKIRLNKITDKVITSCPLCYMHLKENSETEILELSEVLV